MTLKENPIRVAMVRDDTKLLRYLLSMDELDLENMTDEWGDDMVCDTISVQCHALATNVSDA